MNAELINKYPVNAVPISKFAELIGKSREATKTMVKHRKLPTVKFNDPDKPNGRTCEIWISITEFNRAMDRAYYHQPKEQRDAWLLWLGLEE
ncbi:Cox family DNA-binding protein [Arsenophonus nasoniae]|uniref:Cox family DNA-binding protein n=1 Tax=Arsenophonus nasoniae TaxID=638 RepID=A0AA95GBJ1_9GAMM|nr:Cox family DNA-binding protein [Arsenophonus nasoniae]WGL93973.1 Cox family DNA-binding protein [Arsenophonus nasoniae]